MFYKTAELNRYHLGLWYGSYRLIIASCLLIVFFITFPDSNQEHSHPRLYIITLILYFTISCIQLISYKIVRHHLIKSITFFFAADVIAYSCLIFASNGPNLQISWLFVIVIFAASILLESKKALFITLIAIISLIYQNVVGSFFSFSSLKNISNSVLLSVLFLFIYICGQITIKRFQFLERSNFYQSLELNRLQNINRYILEQIETGYLVLDENCHLVLSNPASQHLLGINPIFASDAFPLYKAQPDLFEILQFDQLQDGEKFQFTSRFSEYTTLITVQKLNVPHQMLTLLVIQDAKRINQQVQQLKLASLGQLSASIAHEIRNPLAAIVQANNLYVGSDEQSQAQLSSMIQKQAFRINKIIEDTLSMVKNKETSPSIIHLDSFFNYFIKEDLFDIAHKIKIKSQADLKILFDESQFRQVLINLIRNAVRHNHPLENHVIVSVYQKDHSIRIDVKDFGDGVSPQDVNDLFQPFFSTEINGTGLGLYLSMSFCEANQAKLTYIEQESGACFRIECSVLAAI